MKIIIVIFLLVPFASIVLFWIYAFRKGWRYLRLLAISLMAFCCSLTIILWLGTQDIYVLRIGLTLSIVSGVNVLLWRTIASDFVKKIGFRW